MTRVLEIPDVQLDRPTFLQLASHFADEPGTCLLYSGTALSQTARSFLFLFPYDHICVKGSQQWHYGVDETQTKILNFPNPWDALKHIITPCCPKSPYPEWVGYLNYEMGAFSDVEKQLPYHSNEVPDGYFQRCAVVIILEHATGKICLSVAENAIPLLNEGQREWISRFEEVNFWPSFVQHLAKQAEIQSSHNQEKPELILNTPIETLEEYAAKIVQAKELINAGEIYQVNLSQQFVFSGTCHPFSIFSQLAHLNPAPFSAYFKHNDFAIVSSSPERFLSCRDGILETRPIKGTAPRGKTEEDDFRYREQLLASEKEIAELLMITDLMRNDLGKISEPGSVDVVELRECESYTNVFHLVSTIRSKSLDIHPIDKIRACFPGGSISGCPKLSAMEVIQRIENRRRGIYTGGIGYIAQNGNFDFNIAIRTLFIEKEKLTVQVGGGIVADSNPEKEYLETLYKGASMFQVLGVDLL